MKKRITAWVLIIAALFSILPVLGVSAAFAVLAAIPNKTAVLINGKETEFGAYLINDYNYLKLRDIAYMLNGTNKQFSVNYDEKTKEIILMSGKAYTAVGGEMVIKSGDKKTPVLTKSEIYFNGSKLTLTAYMIDGNNYFKLRDIGEVMNFNVSWINEKVVINTKEVYYGNVDVPEMDYKGYKFRILADSKDKDSSEIYADSVNGTAINDAVYMRNIAVSAKYNIFIEGWFSDNPETAAKKSVQSGDNNFDIFAIPMYRSAQLATQGCLIDLYCIPYIDFDKPWWDKNAIKQLSIMTKLHFTTSDLLISHNDATSIFLFNKRLFVDCGFEDPYNLVKEGKWTVDKMFEMSKKAARDLNGDGKIDAKNDMFGLLVYDASIYKNVLGSGSSFVMKDANDLPYLDLTERLLKSFNKWINIYKADSTFVPWEPWEWSQFDVLFREYRALFMYSDMSVVPMQRTYEADFGILPNPKIDENQESYVNAVNPFISNSVSIPVTNSDLERTGIILEAMTAESYYTLRPAYYDLAVSTKFYRDEESSEMLDIIFANRFYDLGLVYQFGVIINMLDETTINGNSDVVSQFDKYHKKIEAGIEEIMEKFSELK